jgi:hypothetical protein
MKTMKSRPLDRLILVSADRSRRQWLAGSVVAAALTVPSIFARAGDAYSRAADRGFGVTTGPSRGAAYSRAADGGFGVTTGSGSHHDRSYPSLGVNTDPRPRSSPGLGSEIAETIRKSSGLVSCVVNPTVEYGADCAVNVAACLAVPITTPIAKWGTCLVAAHACSQDVVSGFAEIRSCLSSVD